MDPCGSSSSLGIEQDVLDPVEPSDPLILLIPLRDLKEGEEEVIEIYEQTEDGNEQMLMELVVGIVKENNEEPEIDVSGNEE